MNRQQFNEWLIEKNATESLVEWCNEHPDLSVQELINICPHGEWLLWMYAKAGHAPDVLAPVAYRAATRAMGYAAAALDRAGLQHGLRGLVITDRESAQAAADAAAWVDAWSAHWAADAAALAAAHSAAWAAWAAARAANAAVRDAATEHQLCADDCRELLPVWDMGGGE